MAEPVDRLLACLDLCQTAGDDTWTTWTGETGPVALNMSGRLFGGIVLAQTIVAAGRTNPARRVHSLQQVFLRGGRADMTVDYRVQMLFEGRTFATARVEAHQDGIVISHAQVGFTTGVEGPDRQDDPPERPPLASTINRDEVRERPNWKDQPVLTFIEPGGHDTGKPDLAFWLRPAGPMPDDPLMHQAVLAYVTDRGLMSVAWQPHAHEADFSGATLDHSIWFHRPIRFDDWHSHVMHSPTLTDGRGLNHGVVHDQAGIHVASTVQQGMMRPRQPD